MNELPTSDSCQTPAQELDRQSMAYTEHLSQHMHSRLELARSLRQLNQAQATLVSSGETEPLLSLLTRKQTLLEHLTALQVRLQPYLSDEPEARVWETEAQRLRCRDVAQEGSRILAEALQVEKNTLEEITARRDAVAAQLRDGSDAISARNAYATNDHVTGSLLDIGGV